MSDTEIPDQGSDKEEPAAAGAPASSGGGLLIVPGETQPIEDVGLLIIPGGPVADEDEIEALAEGLAEAAAVAEIPGEGEVPAEDPGSSTSFELDIEEPTPAPQAVAASAVPESHFTLDELIGEMADVATVDSDGVPTGSPSPVVSERHDAFAVAMSEAHGDIAPVHGEMWTRAPFWVLGAGWTLFVCLLTVLLWPEAKGGFAGKPMYDLLVFGGTCLVVLGLAVAAIIVARGRSLTTGHERTVAFRVLLRRALGWNAFGVLLWVVSLVLLSLHSLDVIP